MGMPKALLTSADGTPRLATAVRGLQASGCAPVVVVLGAEAEAASRLLPTDEAADDLAGEAARVVVAERWAEGMGESLAAGLQALLDAPSPGPQAALVTLVDLPDVTRPVLERVVERWSASGLGAGALVRATYDGHPGHPVVLGRDHWVPLLQTLGGDVGAAPYLVGRRVLEVSCEDLATGRDLDRPADLRTAPEGE